MRTRPSPYAARVFLDTRFDPPHRQRVAAYAVILRGAGPGKEILLSRLAPYLSVEERWTLPGGGVDFGEHPRDGVVREVYEETGLHATVSEFAWVDSAQRLTSDPTVAQTYMHSLRIVFEGWVPNDSPDPAVIEVDGSTVDARWHRVVDVLDGTVPTVATVAAALAAITPVRRQRLAAYALIRRDDEVLLTRIAGGGFGSGRWHLPGGGVGHGESPRDALRREVAEECGLDIVVGTLLDVHDVHVRANAPGGRFEDFHGVHLVFAAQAPGTSAHVVEEDGTTDAVAWIEVADIRSGRIEVTDVVHAALS